MAFRVLQPGTFFLKVGPPRGHLRRYGLPLGGPADAISAALGNALVGNPIDAPVYEIALSGPTIRFELDCLFAVVGAQVDLQLDDLKLESNSSRLVRSGQTLRIGRLTGGGRCYLCLNAEPDCLGFRSLSPDWFAHVHVEAIRVLPGPQRDAFPNDALSGSFSVRPESNRMGIRLLGAKQSYGGDELVSEAIAPGAIQVANDGQCILIGVDGQTIGGYPKIAHVIAADLPSVGQLRPGQSVCFEWVTEESARQEWDQRQWELRGRLLRLGC